MQLSAVLASALFVGANAVSTQVEVNARAWMLHHSGNPDELAELKSENPDAYALVKALLTKRSLGLLDPRHPTASFAAPPPKDSEDKPVGAAVYAKFATSEKEQEALQGTEGAVPYPEAPAAQSAVPYPEATQASHDWINWKPHDGGMDDDAMVKNVLGAVADLTKGKSLRGQQDSSSDDTSPLAAETAAMSQAPIASSPPEATTTAQAVVHENSYLKVLDVTPAETMKSEATGGTGNALAAFTKSDGVGGTGNALASFSWDDSSTSTTTASAPKVVKGVSNSLASWLGLAKPHVQTAVVTTAKQSNPYLMDLGDAVLH